MEKKVSRRGTVLLTCTNILYGYLYWLLETLYFC
jgi:hypothetical protein